MSVLETTSRGVRNPSTIEVGAANHPTIIAAIKNDLHRCPCRGGADHPGRSESLVMSALSGGRPIRAAGALTSHTKAVSSTAIWRSAPTGPAQRHSTARRPNIVNAVNLAETPDLSFTTGRSRPLDDMARSPPSNSYASGRTGSTTLARPGVNMGSAGGGAVAAVSSIQWHTRQDHARSSPPLYPLEVHPSCPPQVQKPVFGVGRWASNRHL